MLIEKDNLKKMILGGGFKVGKYSSMRKKFLS
jgi:hypothetical protein